jgi:LPXTG-motif cell wall-anchored protein
MMALAVLLGVPGAATAGEGTTSDPRELGTRLDLKGLTHADDGSAVVYTAETYAPFTDRSAAFKWGIDRDGDEDFDLFVTTEWRGGKLAGGVKDAAGKELATAAVSRPGPNAIKVSFPVAVLGGAGAYRYAVNAGHAEGEGGGDLAPDAGLLQHRLGTIGGPSGTQTRAAAAAAPAEPVPVDAAPPSREAAAASAPEANLPTTGSDDGRALLPVAGAAFMAGGALIAAAPRGGRRSWRGVR